MTVSLTLLETLLSTPPTQAWTQLFEFARSVCAAPLTESAVASDVQNRDRRLAPVDLFLATAAWDLWLAYESSVRRTSEEVVQFWTNRSHGKAILILDGL